jgi:hypothetical protein
MIKSITKESFWPGKVRITSFEELPIGKNILMISEIQARSLKRNWTRKYNEDGEYVLKYIPAPIVYNWCAIEFKNKNSYSIKVSINTHSRFHVSSRILPKKHFIACVQQYEYEKQPYLIVSQSWFKDFERSMFSNYALIDAIGMKSLLEKQGRLENAQVQALRKGIDSLSKKYSKYVFFTFADNVIVKLNWKTNRRTYSSTYRPEEFIEVVEEVNLIIKKAIGLKSYSVITQGWNDFVQPTPIQISKLGNHIFFGGLGGAFADLLEIDSTVRKSIREKRHASESGYLSDSFFDSLRFKKWRQKELYQSQMIKYNSAYNKKIEHSYLPINIKKLLKQLKPLPRIK